MTNFVDSEFHCPCTRKECDAKRGPHRLLGLYLDRVREYYGKPMIVTSGNRCAAHNADVKGEEKSEHVYPDGCLGCDIRVTSSHDRAMLEEALRVVGITRKGHYTDGHLHVGVGDIIDAETWPPAVTWVR